jgi:hypothetical protein
MCTFGSIHVSIHKSHEKAIPYMRNRIFYNFFFVLAFLSLSSTVFAQEIKANVTLDKTQLTGATGINYVDDIKSVIERYINEHKWTTDTYREEERIVMNIQVALLSIDGSSNFEAAIIMTAERPIYNSTSQSMLFQFSEPSWKFNYTPNRTLLNDPLQYDDFATMLDYYVLLALGYDGDSFAELGGTPYFRRAQNIVDVASAAGGAGWSSSTTALRNRYFLISRLNDPNYDRFRRAFYQYHRRGLDLFIDNQATARSNVMDALRSIYENKRQTADTFVFDMFFNAKFRELAGIFGDADQQQRIQAYQLLSQADPSHLTEYDKLR